MQSCIYEGRVRHSRTRPASHRFSYRMFMMYLDLDELPTLFERRLFWAADRPAPARFRREHHPGDPEKELSECVRDLVEKETGLRPAGPIRLLTHLSYFGYCFNPVSFYYCYSEDGVSLETIVAEVNNTPWGERDVYVLPNSMNVGDRGIRRFQPTKKMHVSPFMPMNLEYDWCFSEPGDRLSVYMANSTQGERFFDASIGLKRKEISGASLSGVLLRFPFMTLKVITAIYWQALQLWLKRCPIYTHPGKRHKVAAEAK